jgi:hypothetical protein
MSLAEKSIRAILLGTVVTYILLSSLASAQYMINEEEGRDIVFEGEPPKPPISSSPTLNCAVHELSMPSQKFRAAGSTGGNGLLNEIQLEAIAYPLSLNLYDLEETPDEVVDRLNLQSLAQQFSNDTAIIVLDEFSSENEDFHGDLVSRHIQRLIKATGEFVIDESSSAIGNFNARWFEHTSNFHLVVVDVPLGELKTSTISAKLREALDVLSGFRIVVNMSFVLIPCATVEEFWEKVRSEEVPDFETYLASLIVDEANRTNLIQNFINYPAELKAFIEINKDAFDNKLVEKFAIGESDLIDERDPLLEVITNPGEHSFLSFVASAGNFSLPFPMFPAANENVIGVAALNRGVSYSNDGEIVEYGDWYRQTRTEGEEDFFVAGTSFSAPNVSVFVALDMARQMPEFTVVDIIEPPLVKICPNRFNLALESVILNNFSCSQ